MDSRILCTPENERRLRNKSRRRDIQGHQNRLAGNRANAREKNQYPHNTKLNRAAYRYSRRSCCRANYNMEFIGERRIDDPSRNRYGEYNQPKQKDIHSSYPPNRGNTSDAEERQPSMNMRTNTAEITNRNIVFQHLLKSINNIAGSGVNHSLLPEFDPAHNDQTVVTWLQKVNEYADMCDWPDQVILHYAVPKLRGLAKKWYASLPTVFYTWDEFQDKLKFAFPSHENYGQILTTMLAKRSNFNDSLEQYYYDKLILLHRCGIEGKQAIDCIVHGIDDRSVRVVAEATRFKTSGELLSFLKTC